ncbi:hypothetical protein HAX54_037832 [Datura stramonium]|uniref:Uncharacterized protein n=1 Tax=Datura stramonium TaxID=4076 RepID=A0ABS8SIF0_DATST|nr:hypothetical protein [Datura stramonium]
MALVESPALVATARSNEEGEEDGESSSEEGGSESSNENGRNSHNKDYNAENVETEIETTSSPSQNTAKGKGVRYEEVQDEDATFLRDHKKENHDIEIAKRLSKDEARVRVEAEAARGQGESTSLTASVGGAIDIAATMVLSSAMNITGATPIVDVLSAPSTPN